jgi:peptidyl-prolyl cis-trans isomerase C
MTGIALAALEARSRGRRLWAFVRREPLVHFVVLGALLFGADALRRHAERETIVIDPPAVQAMVDQQVQLLGRPLSEAERRRLVQGMIDDAVLLREAYKRGLEQDSLVEQHLVQKMRFMLNEDLPEPSEAELRAYLQANLERYRMPAKVTLDQVYFANPAAVPDGLLERLRAGADIQGLGDPLYMLGPRLTGYSARDLGDLFGTDNAEQIFEAPPGEWQGPLHSAEGVHFVRVVAMQPAHVPAFEDVQNSVREDWRQAQQRAIVELRVEELRAQYRIVVEPGEAAPEAAPEAVP